MTIREYIFGGDDMTVRELLEQAFCVEDCAMIKYIYD